MSVKYTSYLAEVEGKINKSLEKKINQAGLFMVGEIRKTLSGQRSGREYLVPGTKKIYTASAPGEPPARRTGDLARSIEMQKSNDYAIQVGSELEKARKLELGTAKIAPRPFLKKTFLENQKNIEKILGQKVK